MGESCGEFSQEVSIIGLKYVYDRNAHWVRRVIWILLLLTGLGITFFLVSQRIGYYVSEPKSVDFEIRPKMELDFPTVTLCSQRVFGKEWLEQKQTDLSIAFDTFLHTTFYRRSNKSLPDMKPFLSVEDEDKFILEAPRRLLHLCEFMYRPCPSDMIESRLTDLYMCLAINGNDSSKYTVNNVGSHQGLTVHVTLNQSDIIDGGLRISKGFSLVIHWEEKLYNLRRRAMILPIGKEVQVSMKKRVTTLVNSVGAPCRENQEGKPPYSKDVCLDECLSRMAYSQCGCVEPGLETSPGQVRCRTAYQWNCNLALVLQFTANATIQQQCACPEPCTTTEFNTVTSYSELTDKTMSHAEEADHIRLQIYYRSLSVEYVTQYPAYQFWTMMCDIGGALGLFVGSALYTVVEIVDFGLIHLIKRKYNRSCMRRANVNCGQWKFVPSVNKIQKLGVKA